MKKVLSNVFILTLFLFSSCLFANSIEIGKNGENFLKTYYSSGYSIGKSIETKVDNEQIVISEILNKKTGNINGYVAINKSSSELLFFVDYMIDSKEIKAIDFKNNSTDIINLQKDNKFENFVKIDLIKEIEKINFSPSSTNKFWGESCGPKWYFPDGSCARSCQYFVLWISVDSYVSGC